MCMGLLIVPGTGRVEQYRVQRNPSNGLWYVLGYCGYSKSGKMLYIPVSDGYHTRGQAEARTIHQSLADDCAKDELYGLEN